MTTAHSHVLKARKEQRLIKGPCSECASTKNVVAHHDDYAKPFDVRWLCRSCHGIWHAKHGPGINRDLSDGTKSKNHMIFGRIDESDWEFLCEIKTEYGFETTSQAIRRMIQMLQQDRKRVKK